VTDQNVHYYYTPIYQKLQADSEIFQKTIAFCLKTCYNNSIISYGGF